MTYYDDIYNLPILIFHRITNGESLELLIKKRGVKVKPVCLVDAWEQIQEQFFNEFPPADNYKSYLEKSLRIMKLRIQAQLNNEPMKRTKASIMEIEAKGLIDGSNESNLYADIALLNKEGFTVSGSTPVIEFYHIIKLNNQNAKSSKQ